MSACKHSGKPLSTEFISMPFVYVQACCKKFIKESNKITGTTKNQRKNNSLAREVIVFTLFVYLSICENFTYLEVLLQSLSQRIRNLMKPNKLPHPQHLSMIPGSSRVQSLDDGGYVTEYTCIHECCNTN